MTIRAADASGFFARSCGDEPACTIIRDVYGVMSYEQRCFDAPTFTEFNVPETGDVVVPIVLED